MEKDYTDNGESYFAAADRLCDDTFAEELSEIFERDSRRYSRALTDEQEARIL